MILDVSIQQHDQEYFIGKIALIEDITLKTEDIRVLPQFIKGLGNGQWLETATRQTVSEMDNCTKKLIRESEAELVKAKRFLKENYPIRYRLSFVKVILKNPFKTLIAKCLLSSK
jgi:hypothetical protein